MHRKPAHRPSPLTALGLYVRHLSRKLSVGEDELNPMIDIMPAAPSLLSFTPPAGGPLAAMLEPDFWTDIDKAVSKELGQEVTTVVEGGVGHVRLTNKVV